MTAVALLAAPAVASGANTFVDKDTGNNANSCLLATAPCQTIGGMTGGLSKTGAGNTVFVDPAATAYSENVTLDSGRSLAGSDFGTIEGGQPIVDGDVGIAINVAGAAGTIQGLTIQGATGVALDQPATVTGDTFNETADDAVMVNASAPAGTSLVSGNTFTGNTGATIDQTGVLASSAPLQITGNQFNGVSNAIEPVGDGADATISGNTISGVHQGTFTGEGIYVNSDPNPTIVGNLINAPGSGAINGILVNENTGTAPQTGAVLRRNRILGNFSASFRADETTAPVSLDSDLIAGNTGGFGVSSNDFTPFGAAQGDVALTNVTLADNSQDIALQDTAIAIDSSIVQDLISSVGTIACTITFSRGPTTTPGGNGCLNFQTSAVPAFAGASDYHLQSSASNLANLIDHGNPAAPANPLDLDGNPRAIDIDGACPLNQVRDMGAYELQVSQPSCAGPTSPSPSPSPSPLPVTAGPTGLRAAALKKCKKKHGQARRKCKKRANLLPI
jgi:parallel beta helix pectate lyase-like protein